MRYLLQVAARSMLLLFMSASVLILGSRLLGRVWNDRPPILIFDANEAYQIDVRTAVSWRHPARSPVADATTPQRYIVVQKFDEENTQQPNYTLLDTQQNDSIALGRFDPMCSGWRTQQLRTTRTLVIVTCNTDREQPRTSLLYFDAESGAILQRHDYVLFTRHVQLFGGRWLLFAEQNVRFATLVSLIDMQTGELLIEAEAMTLPLWSPDEQYFIQVASPSAGSGTAVWLFHPASQRSQRLQLDRKGAVRWSPDSRFISYQRQNDAQRFELVLLDRETLNQRVVYQSAHDFNYDWSPSAAMIAIYQFQASRYDPLKILLLSLSRAEIRLLADKVDGLRFLWSPDSQYLVYNHFRADDSTSLHLLDVHSGAQRQLTQLAGRILLGQWEVR